MTTKTKTEKRLAPRIQKVFKKPSLTEQQHKADCDINTIVRRLGRDGIANIAAQQNAGMYLDVSQFTGYQEALDLVNSAQESFTALPSAIRNKFNNDPMQFIQAGNAGIAKVLKEYLIEKKGGTKPPSPASSQLAKNDQ